MTCSRFRRLYDYLLIFLTAGICSLVQCSQPVAGGTSTTDNPKVIGRVVNRDGSPAGAAVVMLYPADYNPVADAGEITPSTDTTDSSGYYRVTAPDSTTEYSIVATDPQTGTSALLTDIVLTGTTTEAAEAKLVPPGAVSIAVPDSAAVAGGYVYIPGTGIVVYVSNSGMVLLGQVPEGILPSVNYVAATAPLMENILTTKVAVASEDTVVLPYPQWRYLKKVYLNTTASGADVAGDVTDFPVLLRLTENNFDFTQARSDGADLRFSDAAGTRLAREIESWDDAENAAVLWVCVPEILGDNDSQYIVMYWGATPPDTVGSSNGAGVFDTSKGFEAVWHLSGAGDETASDATENGYQGTPVNMDAASAVAGVIGNARHFDGTSGYITIPNSASGELDMPQNGEFAVSCWVYADTLDSLWHAIAGKGHEQYYLKLKCFEGAKATWEFVEFQDQEGWAFTEDSIPPAPGEKQWVYLTGVRSGSEQYLYINGEQVNDSTHLMTGDYGRENGDDFTIGRHARAVTIPYDEGWCYFRGMIDEVRVMSVAPEPDWIRLCYMNQKTEDKLVEFR
ncbi:MAG: DUF2341 domain-containing protein [Chitinispirillaceae bacterium]|nr:DUF2341 domain-containing protein [Chitinispirillaceae bacterium]